ncbi:hypothetical protein Lal_00038047 [Lupinus albus]|nr:hypothetical protein Lal_00038047 [Lupinus albus]
MTLIEWASFPNIIIHEMAKTMMEKFDKYWYVVNGVMAICTILDPRYKMALLTFYFPKFYGSESYYQMENVKSIFQDLVIEYGRNLRDNEINSSSSSSNLNMNSIINDDVDFDKYVIENYNSANCKTKCEFDILNWWKTNGAKYHTLQMIVKDLLVIPISIVVSESAFSTSGRFLIPHRSRLCPHTSETLMCLQDWLWTDVRGFSKLRANFNFITNTILDDINDDDVSKFIDVVIYKEPIDPCVVDGGILYI